MLLFWKGGHPQKSAPAAGFWNPMYVNPIKFQSALSIYFCKYVYCMTSNFLFQNHFAHWWTGYEFKICYELFFNVPIRILASEASPIKAGAGGEALGKCLRFFTILTQRGEGQERKFFLTSFFTTPVEKFS